MSVWSGLSVVEPVEHNSDASSGQRWDSLQSVGPNQLWVNERYVYKILNSQFSQLSTKRSRLNHSSCKYSALSCALVFYSVFSCPSSHICKTGRLLALRYTDRAWNFWGQIADVSPAKSTAVPSFRFLCGGRVRQWWRWGVGEGRDGCMRRLHSQISTSLTSQLNNDSRDLLFSSSADCSAQKYGG